METTTLVAPDISCEHCQHAIEGALQGSFMHSSFALSTLLYTTDDSIRAYYENVRQIGSYDRQMRLMSAGSSARAAMYVELTVTHPRT